MNNALRLTILVLAATSFLAGCSRMSGTPVYQAAAPQTAALPPSQPTPVETSPAQQLEQQAAGLTVSGFVSASALPQLTEKDRTEASSAQFYALQFGRPGAPRNWSGDTGATGKVTVGPFIRVNNLDCREFTHEVTISGESYTQSGTSCRELTGEWQVVATG